MDLVLPIKKALIALNFKASLDDIILKINDDNPELSENLREAVLRVLNESSIESDPYKVFRKMCDPGHETIWELVICPTDFSKEILRILAYELEREDYLEACNRLNCFSDDEIIKNLTDQQIQEFNEKTFLIIQNIWSTNGYKLFKKYTREDVRRIFDPLSPVGKWKVQSFISLEDHNNIKNGAVFFSTVGAEQAGVKFNDSISADGIFSWDCQPNQNINSRDIQFMINSGEDEHFYAFYRLNKKDKYTNLGELRYISHEPGERTAIKINWQLKDHVIE